MYVLSNVARLFDGRSADPSSLHAGVDVVVSDGRIDSIAPHDSGRAASGDRMPVVDCSAYTVTPGLVDCHAHVTVLGLDRASLERSASPEGLLDVERVLYRTLVDGGVTTLRDMGGATARLRELVAEGELIGPRLKVAICMLSSTGGHADFRGPDRCPAELSALWPPAPGRPSSIVDGPWECRRRVREIAACGADLIKICASPGAASPSDHLEHRDLSAEEVEAICVEASARGLRVAAHAHSQNGIELALRSGAVDIQHASFLKRRHVELARERGGTITPTVWVTEALLEEPGLDPFVREKVDQVRTAQGKALRHASEGGLPILFGSDAFLSRMHGRNYMELVQLFRMGLPALTAWHAATGFAAAHVGQSDAGILEPGRRADLLAFDQDVLSDPEALDRGALVEVVQDGHGHRGGLSAIPQRTFSSLVERALGEPPAPRSRPRRGARSGA